MFSSTTGSVRSRLSCATSDRIKPPRHNGLLITYEVAQNKQYRCESEANV